MNMVNLQTLKSGLSSQHANSKEHLWNVDNKDKPSKASSHNPQDTQPTSCCQKPQNTPCLNGSELFGQEYIQYKPGGFKDVAVCYAQIVFPTLKYGA